MIGYGLDRGGPKDSETAPNSFLTKINGKGFWRFATDMYSGRYLSRNVTLINFWTFVTVLRNLFPQFWS